MIFIYFISFGLLGLIFDLVWGFFIGVAFAGLIFLLLAHWGEKLILVATKSRYVTDDDKLINQVKNFCTHLALPEVKVYWSQKFVNNLYFACSYYGTPTLIIGKNIYNEFSRNELNSLIYASLLKFKSREAHQRTMTSMVFFTLNGPIFLLKKILKGAVAQRILNSFLYPAYYLSSKLYERRTEVMLFDAQVGMHDGLRKDYLSALFKIDHMKSCEELSAGSLLINDLSHAKNQSQEVFSYLLINKIDIVERVKALK